jgi:hypothetical protein
LPSQTILDHALALARRGYRVFPVLEKKPALRDFSGRHTYYQLATDAPSLIKRWWTRRPYANLGVAPGPRLVVLDVEDGPTLDWLTERLGKPAETLLASTRSVRTGGGGFHLYYQAEALYLNRCRVFDQRIDIKTWGGFVLAPPSRSRKGLYQYINDVEPSPLPAALRERFEEEGFVRLGEGMVRPVQPRREPVGWDKDECAEERSAGKGSAGGAPGFRETLYPVLPPLPLPGGVRGWFKKARQMLIKFPIIETSRRDAQQGRLVAHLVRTHRRRGQEFIRRVGRRWLFDQRERFQTSLEEAYAHLDRNIESAWTRENPDGTLKLAGPDEQHYLDRISQQWIPNSQSLAEARSKKRGIGAGELLTALMRFTFWKLLNTDEDAIRFTTNQLIRLSGLSKPQVYRLKNLYITRPGKPATALRVLLEREVGHHDERGQAIPSAYDLDDDWTRLAFPEEYP